MLNCIALYRGERLSDLELVTLCSDPQVVAEFVDRLLRSQVSPNDPVLAERREGTRKALRLIAKEAPHG